MSKIPLSVRFKRLFIGKKAFQPFFEKLFKISLYGMNYGAGGMTETSGELEVIKKINTLYQNKQCVIFDIGANNGEYAVALLKYLKNNFKIHSFEPGEKVYKELAKRLKNNPDIDAHKIALSDKTGTSKLFFDEEGTTFASMNQAEYKQYNIHLKNSEEIETITLDEFCEKAGINKIHFCKIDVEGHELNVLKGAKKMLSQDAIDIIQFEFGLASTHSGSYLKDFFDLLTDYSVYRILQDGIYPIKYNERYEIFLTTNYLAVHKSVNY